MARKKKNELWVDIFNKFIEQMEEKGFSTLYLSDTTMPKVICNKKNHYRFTMIAFLYPTDKPVSISLQATVGTDIHTVMYFQMENIEENTWERFDTMLKAAEKYIEYEIGMKEEDRRKF